MCGCSDEDPCYNPSHGFCWWVDETHELCSHCAEEEIADDPETIHRFNTLIDNQHCSLCANMNRAEGVCMAHEECKFEEKTDENGEEVCW